MRRKDLVIRQKIYNLLCMNYSQEMIEKYLLKQHFKVDRARVSRIIKEFIDNGYVRVKIKTVPIIYVITRRKYLPCHSLKGGGSFKDYHGDRSMGIPQKGEIRVHNQCIIFNVKQSSPMFDGDVKSLNPERAWFGWDLIAKRNKNRIDYMYLTPQGVRLIRHKGKYDDSIQIFLPDDIWTVEEFEHYNEWYEEQVRWWLVNLERFFGIELEFRKSTKAHFAINPLTPEMGRLFMEANITVGDVHGDASHGFPELEFTGGWEKALETMKMLDRMERASDEDKKRSEEGLIAYG